MKQKKTVAAALAVIVFLLALAAVSYGGIRWYGRNSLLRREDSPWLWVFGQDTSGLAVERDGHTYAYRGDLVNILCMGVDKSGAIREYDNVTNYGTGQSDVIFLASLDLRSREIRLLAIPRETMVDLDIYTDDGEFEEQRRGQLTLQYAYGDGRELSGELMAARVQEVLGADIPIHGYVAVDRECILPINDLVGGVEVTMDADYTMFNPAFVEGATVRLTDENVLDFLVTRDKHSYGSSANRFRRHQLYVNAFLAQAKQVVKQDPTLPVRFLEEAADYVLTDMDAAQITYLVTEAVDYRLSAEGMYTVPGEYQYAGTASGYAEFTPDEEALWEIEKALFYEED